MTHEPPTEQGPRTVAGARHQPAVVLRAETPRHAVSALEPMRTWVVGL